MVSKKTNATDERKINITFWTSPRPNQIRVSGISAAIETAAVAKGSLSYRDVDGAYAAWFEKLGAKAVLVRPDFHVFGAVADGANVDAMVRELGKQLALNLPERRGGNAA